MRAKNEYKLMSESYAQVHEGLGDRLKQLGSKIKGKFSKGSGGSGGEEVATQEEVAAVEEIPPMQKFGNVQIEHKGKDENNADTFRVYKDGQYVLHATLFGDNINQPRTFTLFADPQSDGQSVPNPNQPLMELDRIQTAGDFEKLAKLVNDPTLHPRVKSRAQKEDNEY